MKSIFTDKEIKVCLDYLKDNIDIISRKGLSNKEHASYYIMLLTIIQELRNDIKNLEEKTK